MRILFLGRRPHAITALSWLMENGHDIVGVVCPSGIGKEATYWSPTLRDFADVHGLLRILSEDVHNLAEQRDRSLENVDLVVSFLYWRKIRSSLAILGRFGCINFHPAPLPEYKGLGGYNFAILNRETHWGATAHYVDAGFDTGPIIAKKTFDFDCTIATAFSLERLTRTATLELFREVISEVDEKGWLSTTENSGGTYVDRATMDSAKRVDLQNMSGEEIERRARAFWYPPFEGAHIEKDGKRFTLVDSHVLKELEALHRE